MSGLREFHILEPLTQILNAFFSSSSVSYFEIEIIISCVMIMAAINFFEVGQQIYVSLIRRKKNVCFRLPDRP